MQKIISAKQKHVIMSDPLIYFSPLRLKFSQNQQLRDHLVLKTGKMIAEANPYDNFFGIKMGMHDEGVTDVGKWAGRNMMGRILMELKEEFRSRYYK